MRFDGLPACPVLQHPKQQNHAGAAVARQPALHGSVLRAESQLRRRYWAGGLAL